MRWWRTEADFATRLQTVRPATFCLTSTPTFLPSSSAPAAAGTASSSSPCTPPSLLWPPGSADIHPPPLSIGHLAVKAMQGKLTPQQKSYFSYHGDETRIDKSRGEKHLERSVLPAVRVEAKL